MRKFIGWTTIILSIALALYVGLWVLFAGGIIQIVNGINPLNGVKIAFGALRIILASPVGVSLAFLGAAFGNGILLSGDENRDE